ncbi:MAG: mannose-1-phosphate guanylyltransferase/mannose-6-phosphate isomerase [Pseudomonadota bacterium]
MEQRFNRKVHPVILSGGSGSRLWPISRSMHPKQLQPLISKFSMIQETALRFVDGSLFPSPVVICNHEHRFIIAEQLREAGIPPGHQILEPAGRNTAPAAAVAALCLQASDPGAILLIVPADHAINDISAFLHAISAGARAAESGYLVTFGIQPDKPETGFGYLKKGAEIPDAGAASALFRVERFVEKPSLEAAEEYLRSGDYFWNSGIFMFRADQFLEILGRLRPAMLEACRQAVARGKHDLDFFRLDHDAFLACESDSIDYAVMEHADNVAMIPVNMGWSDVGSWSSLWEIGEKDSANNLLLGDVIAEGSKNSYIRSEHRLVTAIGVENLVIIETTDAVLVANRDQTQYVKEVVEHLKRQGREEHSTHRRVYRPWGFYESIAEGERHQVKHLMVKPGGKLSLQMHHHRAEHWVVVQGTAKVSRDGETLLLAENESIYLPLGCRHRLENPGKTPLSVIEVQSGGYLGEDDIVRFEDVYKREDQP